MYRYVNQTRKTQKASSVCRRCPQSVITHNKCTSPIVDSQFSKVGKLANSDTVLNSFLSETFSISVEPRGTEGQLSFNICSERVERVARAGIRSLSRRAGETLFVRSVVAKLLVSRDRVISDCRFSRKGPLTG